MVFLFGCLVGLIVGVALTVLLWWGVDWVENEQALRPLADLKIPAHPLSADERRAIIDRLALGHLAAKGNVGLVVGIVREGQTQILGYGSTVQGEQRTPDGDTLFEIASVGKTLTAALLAEMAGRGEVALDEPIKPYLPDHVGNRWSHGAAIRLLDLATHHAGLPSLPANLRPDDPLNPYASYTPEQLEEAIAVLEPLTPPGTSYAYSNLGFGLLGHLLERRAGMPYEQLVIERIAGPLGLTSTHMTLDDALRSRLATPHDRGKPVKVWEDTTLAGAGSFLSTANDMLTYLRAHFSDAKTPLSPILRRSITKWRGTDRPATAIGLGWHIDSENALDIVWHNGGSGGSRSYVAFLPDLGLGVVVLANSSKPVEQLGKQLLYLLHDT